MVALLEAFTPQETQSQKNNCVGDFFRDGWNRTENNRLLATQSQRVNASTSCGTASDTYFINFVDPTGRFYEGYWGDVGDTAVQIFGVGGTLAGHGANIYDQQSANWESAMSNDIETTAIGNVYQFVAGGNPNAVNEYGSNDIFTLDLVQSEAFDTQARTSVASALANGATDGNFRVSPTNGASNLDIGVRVLSDGLSFATGGYLGTNQTEAVMGSYGGTWTASNIDYEAGTAVIHYSGQNLTGAESGTRIPLPSWGYDRSNPTLMEKSSALTGLYFPNASWDWNQVETVYGESNSDIFTIRSILNNNPLGSDGPLTNVTQTFNRTEVIHFDPVAGKNPNNK